MTTTRTAAALLAAVLLCGARAARAQEAPSAEDRLGAAFASVMTDEAVDGVAACAAPGYSGWTARSQPGALYFECVRRSGDRLGDPKALIPSGTVQKALAARGLSYYYDYRIFDVATGKALDRAAVDRAAARAIGERKAAKAMRGADALKG